MNGLKDEIINLDNIIMRLLDNSQQLQGKCRKERREYRWKGVYNIESKLKKSVPIGKQHGIHRHARVSHLQWPRYCQTLMSQ